MSPFISVIIPLSVVSAVLVTKKYEEEKKLQSQGAFNLIGEVVVWRPTYQDDPLFLTFCPSCFHDGHGPYAVSNCPCEDDLPSPEIIMPVIIFKHSNCHA